MVAASPHGGPKVYETAMVTEPSRMCDPLTFRTINVTDAVEVARVVEQSNSPSVRRVTVFIKFGNAGVFQHEAPLVGDGKFQDLGEYCLQRTAVGDDQDSGVLVSVVADDFLYTSADSVPDAVDRFATGEFDVDPGV